MGLPTWERPTLSPPLYTLSLNNKCDMLNARFSCFKLERDGPTDQRTHGQAHQRNDRLTDQQTDKASHRVACPLLKQSKDLYRAQTSQPMLFPHFFYPNHATCTSLRITCTRDMSHRRKAFVTRNSIKNERLTSSQTNSL